MMVLRCARLQSQSLGCSRDHNIIDIEIIYFSKPLVISSISLSRADLIVSGAVQDKDGPMFRDGGVGFRYPAPEEIWGHMPRHRGVKI